MLAALFAILLIGFTTFLWRHDKGIAWPVIAFTAFWVYMFNVSLIVVLVGMAFATWVNRAEFAKT